MVLCFSSILRILVRRSLSALSRLTSAMLGATLSGGGLGFSSTLHGDDRALAHSGEADNRSLLKRPLRSADNAQSILDRGASLSGGEYFRQDDLLPLVQL